jgi:hypothetical protein
MKVIVMWRNEMYYLNLNQHVFRVLHKVPQALLLPEKDLFAVILTCAEKR